MNLHCHGWLCKTVLHKGTILAIPIIVFSLPIIIIIIIKIHLLPKTKKRTMIWMCPYIASLSRWFKARGAACSNSRPQQGAKTLGCVGGGAVVGGGG